jgi:hypothetical protein
MDRTGTARDGASPKELRFDPAEPNAWPIPGTVKERILEL